MDGHQDTPVLHRSNYWAISGSFSCFEDDVSCCHYACDVLDYKLKTVKLILSDFKDALLPFKDEQEAGI